MQVIFKNTGMVEAAEIRFNGLTVIAGENDTGKSTIGKLMFSIIKTFNRYEHESKTQEQQIKDLIEGYWATFSQKTSNSDALDMGKAFFDEVRKEVRSMIEAGMNGTKPGKVPGSRLVQLVSDFSNTAKQTFNIELDLETMPPQLLNLLGRTQNIESVSRKYLESVFGDHMIGNVFSKSADYSITGVGEDDRAVFEIMKTGESMEIKQEGPQFFDDATFIETPTIISLSKNILSSKTVFDIDEPGKKVELLEKEYVPVYMKDLMWKLTDKPASGKPSALIDTIRDIIQGDFYYDHLERDFIFKKGNKTFKSLFIASGINYLGIIILLLKNGFLNKRSLLILDEPETNMHPEWQVKFAEVLVRLVKEGNSILLTSHSPYFIEALKLYADKILAKDKISFYFSKKSEGKMTSGIDNVTIDLSPIFDVLSKPFEKLELLQLRDVS